MKINSLKINIITDKGEFGRIMCFSDKLNIILGTNSTGKSTCIEAIIYALGLEELLGAKKEHTLKPALREQLEFKDKIYEVLESYVVLEIENKNQEIVTIKRSIKSENVSPKLVNVVYGPKLTEGEKVYETQDMYLHDSGAATHMLGFHSFLEKFLVCSLPYVPSYRNKDVKLYFQTVFSACIIEQVRGWSDFLATVPTYYGIKHISKRVIEYILDLDVLDNQKKKQEVEDEKKSISLKWNNIVNSIYHLTDEIQGEVQNVPKKPVASQENFSNSAILITREDSNCLIEKEKAKMMRELMELELLNNNLIGEKIEENEIKIDEKMDLLDQIDFEYTDIYTDYKIESKKLDDLIEQLEDIEKDLIKNKDVKKLNKLGSDMEMDLNKNICPTCHQNIKDILLPQDIEQTPMSIEENIEFLKEQKRMVEFHINITEKQLKRKKNKMKKLKAKMKDLRKDIRDRKQELTEDERIPSISDIKKKVELRNKIKRYEKIEYEFDDYLDDLKELSSNWTQILKKEKKLPKQYYSKFDYKKLKDLEKYFRKNVTNFGYKSKSPEEINISEDKYFPTINGFDMKFDSSATDHIRAIWSYTCSLYQVSNKYGCCHPRLIIFDEPGQHQMNSNHIREFFSKLSKLDGNCQSIVTTSLEKPNFNVATENIDYNLIEIEEWSLTPLS